MNKILSALILFSLSFSALALPKDRIFCELELSKRARAAGGLLATSLEKDVIQISDLQRFLNEFPNYSPFSNINKRPESLDLMATYNRLYQRLSDSERAELQKAVSLLVKDKSADVEKIEGARVNTVRVVAPRVFRQFALEQGQLHKSSMPLAVGVKEGRPILSAKFENPAVAKSEMRFLIDPFHPDPNQHMVGTSIEGSSARGNFIFSLGSQTYLTELESEYFYNLTLGKTDRSVFNGVKLNAISAMREYSVVESKRGTLLFAAQTFDDPALGESLVEFNLSHSDVPPKVIHRGAISNLRHQSIDGHEYLSFIGEDSEYSIYDVTAGVNVPTRANTLGMSEDPAGVIYHLQNDRWFAFVDAKRYLKIHNITKGESESHKVDVNFMIRGEINEVKIQGVPHLYYRSQASVVLFNVITKKFSQIPVKNGRFTEVHHFQWNSRTFLVWGSENYLQVFDLDTGTSAGSVPIPSSRYVFRLLRYENAIYALVFTNRDKVSLVEITTTNVAP